jgi:hypothetical protein
VGQRDVRRLRQRDRCKNPGNYAFHGIDITHSHALDNAGSPELVPAAAALVPQQLDAD